MRFPPALPLVLAAALLAAPASPLPAVAAEAAPGPLPAGRLPLLWRETGVLDVPAADRGRIAARLGVPIESLRNADYDAGGIPLRVNVAVCPDEAGAASLERIFVRLHGDDPAFAARRGREAAEIVCGSRPVARRARAALGWTDPPRARWTVSFAAAPLESCPGMRWNRLFNLLLDLRADPTEKNRAAAEEGAAGFAFGRVLRLRDPDPAGSAAAWTGEPAPRSVERKRGEVRLAFGDLPRTAGIPLAEVTGTVPTAAFVPRPAAEGEDLAAFRAPTAAWPAEDPAVKAIAAAALRLPVDAPAGPGRERRRLERILGAVRERVRFGGEVPGSRWGVKELLARGEGRCWDFSDLFVTVCRAAGIPARQAGGWLRGVEGHVWAEAFVEGEGWWPVDPTTTWIGVSEDYVPIWSSDDGVPPLLYGSLPRIEPAAETGK